MLRWIPALLVALVLLFLAARQFKGRGPGDAATVLPDTHQAVFDPAFIRQRPPLIAATPYLTRLSAALGSENGALTYNAQPFLIDRHLGDDLNGIGGWNSDFGDPVFAIGNGLVTYTGTPSPGWGGTLTVAHRNNPEDPTAVIQSFYSHLSSLLVSVGDRIASGDKIGEVGNAAGRYLAHLHLELRKGTASDAGAGYHQSALNRLSPSLFLQADKPSSRHSLLPAILSILSEDSSLDQPLTISSKSGNPKPSDKGEKSAARKPQQ